MTSNDKRAGRLAATLIKLFETHDLYDDSLIELVEDPESSDTSQGAEPVYLILHADGELVNVFEKREYRELRAQFEQIVAEHAFWYEFENATTVSFMRDNQIQR